MSRWFRWFVVAFMVVPLASSFHPGSARAQSLWMPRDQETTLVLEALHTSLELVDEDLVTAGFFLDARHTLSSKIALVGEIPFANFDGDFDIFIGTSHVSQSTWGNPYLGIEVLCSNSPFFGELGVRLPLADEDDFAALTVGAFCDLTRFDAFFPERVSVHALANLREVSASGLATRLRFGPAVLIPTDNEGNPDTELFGIYAWQIGYEGRSLRVGGALSGSILITEDSGNLGQRSENQFEFHADFGPWRIRPGVELKLPLSNVAGLVPVVYGVSVSAAL